METTLNEKEVNYFYNLIFKYEHESHAGYQDDRVIAEVKDTIFIDDQYMIGCNITERTLNTINFTPYRNNKCWAILYHIRNSFAHGNLESVDKDTAFLIKDFSDRSLRNKCNMLCYISKENLYKLLAIMETTRKKPKK